MSELLEQFSEYTQENERLKSVDKWVFVLLFKVFVEFLNEKGYEIHYLGKKNVSRQV